MFMPVLSWTQKSFAMFMPKIKSLKNDQAKKDRDLVIQNKIADFHSIVKIETRS